LLTTLSQDYGVALTTTRKALAALKDEGLVVTSPMSTFVCKDA
jgi:DNA-binding GntR family transcriptional regulator